MPATKSDVKPAALGAGHARRGARSVLCHAGATEISQADRSEAEAVREVVRRLAMSRPDVAFTLAGEERAPVTWGAAAGRPTSSRGSATARRGFPRQRDRH